MNLNLKFVTYIVFRIRWRSPCDKTLKSQGLLVTKLQLSFEIKASSQCKWKFNLIEWWLTWNYRLTSSWNQISAAFLLKTYQSLNNLNKIYLIWIKKSIYSRIILQLLAMNFPLHLMQGILFTNPSLVNILLGNNMMIRFWSTVWPRARNSWTHWKMKENAFGCLRLLTIDCCLVCFS